MADRIGVNNVAINDFNNYRNTWTNFRGQKIAALGKTCHANKFCDSLQVSSLPLT